MEVPKHVYMDISLSCHDISKFSKRCLQRTDATRCREVPRCKFQSETFEAVKAFERKTTYFHRTDAPWVWSLCANGRLERRWHTSKWCWNVTSSNFKCFILQALNYVCIYMVQNCTWHLFHQSKGVQTQGRCSPFFPFFPSRCHPETAETAEALNRRALGGKHNSESSGDASVHEQPGYSPVAGEGRWGRAEVFGVRGDLPGRFTRALGPIFSLFAILLD